MRKFRAESDFYVYLLFSSEVPRIPFYAGKGCGDRDEQHVSRRRSKPSEKSTYISEALTRGHSVYSTKIFVGLGEAQAFRLEAHVVALWGRKPHGPLLNATDGGHGSSGYVFPAEVRERIASKLRGIKWSRAKKAAHAKIQLETMNRPEVKEKLREAMLGRKLGPAHCEAIRAGLTGKPKSAADKKKNGATYAANGRSDACRIASSKANTGKVRSAKHRAAISAAHKGKPKPPEQRKKISESNKRTKALRRAERGTVK